MDLNYEVKKKHRRAADTGGKPQRDPTDSFLYKAIEDTRNGYRLITAT